MEAVKKGSERSSQSSYILLTFAISFFFKGLLENLLPYLMCLLCGCRLNGVLKNGDSLVRLNAERCFEEHNQLEREDHAQQSNTYFLHRYSNVEGAVSQCDMATLLPYRLESEIVAENLDKLFAFDWS